MHILKFILRSLDALLLVVFTIYALTTALPMFLGGTPDDKMVAAGLGVMLLGLALTWVWELIGCLSMLVGFAAWWGGALQEEWKWTVIMPLTPLIPALAILFALHWWLEKDSAAHPQQ